MIVETILIKLIHISHSENRASASNLCTMELRVDESMTNTARIFGVKKRRKKKLSVRTEQLCKKEATQVTRGLTGMCMCGVLNHNFHNGIVEFVIGKEIVNVT